MNIFELMGVGFATVCTPAGFALMFVGVAVGIIFGALPGLSATMAIALFLPVTYTMAHSNAMTLLMALFIGAISGGLISAILLSLAGAMSILGKLSPAQAGIGVANLAIVIAGLGAIMVALGALQKAWPDLDDFLVSGGSHVGLSGGAGGVLRQFMAEYIGKRRGHQHDLEQAAQQRTACLRAGSGHDRLTLDAAGR